MTRSHDIEQYINSVGQLRTPEGLKQLTSDVAREMGFDIVTLFHHVDLSRASHSLDHMHSGQMIGFSTCSPAWSEHYCRQNLLAVDPRVRATRRTASPFSTQEIGKMIPITAVHRSMVETQRRYDLGEGFTIPLHFPGEPSASCTFSMLCGRQLPSQNFGMAHWIATLAFQAGRTMLSRARNEGMMAESPRLTERQLQCTVLVGRGLSEDEIAARLGVSGETVKRHLKEARRTYGVTKSVQLVTESLRLGHITLRDIFSRAPS